MQSCKEWPLLYNILTFQSDSSEALSSLIGDGLVRSAYRHVVAEIKELIKDKEFIPLKLCRDQNRVADRLANYSR